jgi:CubicO group peptidase (beta-lactamase class C family)
VVDERLNEKVHNVLAEQLRRGSQIGAQVAAYRYGKLLVDACAGTMGPDDGRPVRQDTLFPSFSTTKGVAATALHILADRGVIDYDAPVAKYWPAFAHNGKERITVAQAMSHQAGLHAMPRPMRADFVCDWNAGLRWIEESAPAWQPGSDTGYHAITWAWIVGGIIEHADGRDISRVVEEEIARPLGVSGEMYIGIPDGVDDRLATLLEAGPVVDAAAAQRAGVTADSDFAKAMPTDHDFSWNDLRLRQACVPSANGHFTARALARMYGALANEGEIDGVRLVTPARVREMQRIVTEAPDRVLLGMPIRKGIGYFMGGKTNGVHGPMGPRETAFGHPGAGGSIAFADPEAGLAVAVTSNRMFQPMIDPGPDPAFEVCELIRDELGVNA